MMLKFVGINLMKSALFATFLLLNQKVSSICLFPPEFEGEYIIQNAAVNSDMMQYSTINITADWIFPYGQCFSRNESNVIVLLGTEENACFRCFNLKMVSKNIILLIHNEIDINSKCSSSAETVKCPNEINFNDEEIAQNDFHSIILYRTSERDGPRRNEFCPFDFFDDDIKFDYFMNDEKVCGGYESTISQCPSGSSLNIRFKSCNSPQLSANYECIGHWNALNKHYLAVIEWINGTIPKYKCGTYQHEINDGENEFTLKINNDCSSLSSKNGFAPPSKNQQMFKIKKLPEIHESHDTKASKSNFPIWLQGQWQFLNVAGNQLIFKDHSSFKSYRMTLLNQLNDDKFIVSSRSQCGEEDFKCLWIRKLDVNILEFQTSSKVTKTLTNSVLCNEEEYFDNNRWLTQSRIGKDVVKTPCPINGKYFGHFPDDTELCSEMVSSCNSDVMHFQAGPCSSDEIYEKRVYRCLGQWTDSNNSNVYTFTKRIDDVVNTYECFVGLMGGSETQIILREAGENCFKTLVPQNYGMEMNQTESCQHSNGLDKKISIKPTQKDHTIKYETDFDGGNNDIDFNAATSSTTSRKPKTTKKNKNHHHDDNSVETNDIDYEPTSITSTATKQMISWCGLFLMICNLQNSIIVKDILRAH